MTTIFHDYCLPTRERRRTGPLVSPEGFRAAGSGRLVLSDPLLAVGEVLGRLPRVGRRGVARALPTHQVVDPAADRLAVEDRRRPAGSDPAGTLTTTVFRWMIDTGKDADSDPDSMTTGFR